MLFPSVRRDPDNRDLVRGLAFTAGAVGGALSTAALVLLARGLLSPVRGQTLSVAVLVFAVLIAVAQAVTNRCQLPQRHSQIPAEWVAARHAAGARDFGFVLGMGLFTFVPSCAAHLLLLVLCTMPVTILGVVAAALGFGLGRSAEVLARSMLPGPEGMDREPGLRGISFIARWVAPSTATAMALVAFVK